MTADIVNLRRARKDRARRSNEQVAVQNRAVHGTPKAQRRLTEAERTLAARRLDAHRRDDLPEP